MNMKPIKFSGAIGTMVALTLVLMGCQSSKDNYDNMNNAIIMLKIKAQPNKGAMAISELTDLIEKVKLEPNFVEIILHVDSKDDTNILLYEVWKDENYYNTDHMETDHIIEFMSNSSNFLVGPPEIKFYKINKVFN